VFRPLPRRPAILGRATYEPGWRWSQHIAATVGTASCQVEHIGLVLSGQAVAKMDDGTKRQMKSRSPRQHRAEIGPAA
jgi:hypothetical protein